MSGDQIRFNDGDAYEHFMGRWSSLAGDLFLDWLAPLPGLRWADIGCGNGAFTELLFTRANAAHVDGIDPSAGQLEFARNRLRGRSAGLQSGSAMDLPFAGSSYDAVVMALVIFFVSQPEQGIAEMVRVAKPGGIVAAYAWDIPGGGFPTELVTAELRAFEIEPLRPPRGDVSAGPVLEQLWADAGLHDVRSRAIEVEREFASFDEWWSTIRKATSLAVALDKRSAPQTAQLQAVMRDKLRPGVDGRVRCRARANAVAGRKPG